MWYSRTESLRRYTCLFMMSTAGAIVGGLLASAIGKMDGVRGYHAWRWIFILEGCATCFVAGFSWFVVCDFPEDAKFVTDEERKYVRTKLKADQGSSEAERDISVREVLDVLKDFKIYLGSLLYFFLLMPSYGK